MTSTTLRSDVRAAAGRADRRAHDARRAAPPETVTLIEPRVRWWRIDWRELSQARELLVFLAWRDVKLRYRQTVLGVGWAVIQPLAQMAVFSLVLGRLAGVPSDGAPYPLFVLAGLLPWTFFASAVQQSSSSVINHAHLLNRVYFPRLVLPVASVAACVPDALVALGAWVALAGLYGRLPGPQLLLVAPLFVLLAACAIGVGCLLAGLAALYRDVRAAVPLMLQLWLFLTPVVYPIAFVPDELRGLLALNPLTGIIGGLRAALLGGPIEPTLLAPACAATVVILAAGVALFRRAEQRFADVV